MRNTLHTILIIFSFTFSFGFVHAQNAKSFYKDAKKNVKTFEYDAALNNLNNAIEQDNEYLDAFVLRAEVHLQQKNTLQAAEDYQKASQLDPTNEGFAYLAGKLYNSLGRYEDAIPLLDRAIMIDNRHLEAMQEKIVALVALERYNEAIIVAEKAIYTKKTALNYYYHGIVSAGLGNLEIAETDFENAIKQDPGFEKAYISLSDIQLKLGHIIEAMRTANEVIELNPTNKESYIIRSRVHVAMDNYLSAINDLSYILANISKDNIEVLMLRGEYYNEIGQYNNAINDFTNILNQNPRNQLAYFNRAKAYELNNQTDLAVADYQTFRRLSENDSEKSQKLIAHAKDRIYELNRETNNPVLELINPKIKEGNIIDIRENEKYLKLTGIVKDESEIKTFTINGEPQKFFKDTRNNDFNIKIPAENLKEINFVFIDIYENKTDIVYQVVKTEVNPPFVHLSNPQASDNGEIWLQTDNKTLYIQGVVTDDSKIQSIYIDNTLASFDMNEINPSFSATIDIANKNHILISATDIFGNKTERNFTFNRNGLQEFADNPMGKTWVVFIENSNYQFFEKLEGPAKDVSLMKSALTMYDVQNIIHKQNMTKSEMEKFFAIELRDLLQENNVNSLLIWYSGHGKFENETGFWIPTNAKTDDEFTYYNINNLRASMQSYPKNLIHTLIITDACESGPSFYMALRSEPDERTCEDWDAINFKSSQVFTSAGNEAAQDNSQFTRTFARALQYNPDKCISIDKIVILVKEAVSQSNIQEPKFGKIAGLEDENGTFFFIKK
jgi:tetratricopeptide (TPR) repeat protein